MNKPVVALFCTNFLPWSQTFVHEELKNHSRYDAHVFCNKRENADRFPYDSVNIAGPFYELTRWSANFDRAFKNQKYALVHGHFGPGSLYALRYAEKFNLPLVATFHGYDVPLLRSEKRFRPEYLRYGMLAPKLLKRLTLAFCASTELQEMLIELGVPADRARVWRLGIDLSKFTPGNREFIQKPLDVVSIGRFVEKKGFEVALRGFAEAKRRGFNGKYTIFGGGPLESRLRAVVDELSLQDDVVFAGTATQAELAARLSTADVLLAPSVTASDGDRESGLIVIKEASASGTVPVGTWHGGLPEIIDDSQTGFLIPERAPSALADRLMALENPELRARLSSAAREKMIREYDVQKRVAALEDLYDEACDLFKA